jgi:membrane-associated phospholipid phosphatase
MKHFLPLALTASLALGSVPAVQAQQAPSPYKTSFAVDGSIILGEGLLSGLGLYLVQQKHGLSETEQAALNKNDVPKIDRFSAGWYSEDWQLASDLGCYPTLLIAPGLLALNDNVRGRYGQMLGLYVQTVLGADAVFTMTVGNVTRYRPYLYGTEGGSGRTGKIATNSFFAGHTAHTAAATFFAAKAMHDFNPGYQGEAFVWTAAAAVPAFVAYTRVKAGKHFLTDNLVGYTVGAGLGILVPQLHKTGEKMGASLVPIQGINANGYAYSGLLLTKKL